MGRDGKLNQVYCQWDEASIQARSYQKGALRPYIGQEAIPEEPGGSGTGVWERD